MTLIKINNNSPIFINIDYIVSIWKVKDNDFKVSTVDGELYNVSENAYNIILKYGKAGL